MRALWDSIRLALTMISAHRVRSALTLLGIQISVASVVSVVALLQGMQGAVDKRLSYLGKGAFDIDKWDYESGGPVDWKKMSARRDFTLADVEAVRTLPSVAGAGAIAWKGAQKISTRETSTLPRNNIAGGTPEFLEDKGIDLASGRFLNTDDLRDERKVIVLGSAVAEALFAGADPLGQEVRLDSTLLKVVGVMGRRSKNIFGGDSRNSLAVIPITLWFQLFGKQTDLEVLVRTREMVTRQRAEDDVTGLMRQRRGLTPGRPNDFAIHTNDSSQEAKMFHTLTGQLTWATVGICALSLVVGGFGVLNIMLVSVGERTSEIGVRRALGARKLRIIVQFTVEAVVLATLGGALGVLLGYGVAYGVHELMGLPAEVPLWSVALGLGVSTLTGLIFGIQPALRAANLDPAVAIRAA